MQVKRTVEADNDLTELYIWGFQNYGEQQSDSYFDELEQRFQFIADQPFVVPETAGIDPPVRVSRHKAHLIIYRLEPENITILRVVHNRSNWRMLLGA